MKNSTTFLLIASFWIFFLSLNQTLNSGYHFTDDHEIIIIKEELANHSIFDVIVQHITQDFSIPRFRVFYIIHRVVEVYLFNTNYLIWSIYTMFLGIFTSYLLYAFASSISFSWFHSILFTVIALLGFQSAIFWRLGPAETLGIFLLSICLYACVKIVKTQSPTYYIWFIVSVTLCTLCKESFVLIIPALIFGIIWLYQHEKGLNLSTSIKNNLGIIIFLLFLLICEILYIMSISIDKRFGVGYAGLDNETFDFLKIIKSVKNYSTQTFVLPLIVLILGAIFAYPRKDNNEHKIKIFIKRNWKALLLFCLIVLPQIVLYTKSGMTERYLIPASLGSAFLIPYLLNQQYLLRKSFSSILILLFLLQFGVNSYRMEKTANIFAEEGASTNNFLGTIIANTDYQSSILIVANPVNDYEWSLSINRYLNHYDRRNTYFHFTESKNQGNKFNDNLEKRIKTKFEGRISTDISHISCIAIFPQNEQAFIEKHPSTTDFSKFTRNDFDGFVLYLKKN